MNQLYSKTNELLCISSSGLSSCMHPNERCGLLFRKHGCNTGISNIHRRKPIYTFISSFLHNVPCSVFCICARGCIYISAKCSDISKQTPGCGFIFAIFVRYEPLFNSTHGVFYKQGHQIWSLYKYNSKWLHLRTASVPNLDALRNYRFFSSETSNF